jgi:hypothetical protein
MQGAHTEQLWLKSSGEAFRHTFIYDMELSKARVRGTTRPSYIRASPVEP